MKKIEIKNAGEILDQGYYIFNVPYDKTTFEFEVIVDDNPLLDNYKIEEYTNGFISYQKIGNMVFVTVNENTSIKPRNGFLKFVHSMDRNVFYTVNFAQKEKTYIIDIEYQNVHDNIELTFDTLTDKTDVDCETFDINVHCSYGSEDFLIKKVEEYSNEEMTKKIPFDNGVNVKKKSKGVLEIKNYGKITKLDTVRYKVVLCHKDDRNSTKEITMKYNVHDNSNGFGFED